MVKQSLRDNYVYGTRLLVSPLVCDSAENEMNGMTAKELEREKLTVGRMCLELKNKRQVSGRRRSDPPECNGRFII